MRIRGVVAVAVAAVAIFALSACSDDGPEGTTIGAETTTAEATPDTPSPTVSATESNATPDEKKGSAKETLDAAGKAEVEQTVSTFLQALGDAYKTGKTADARSLTHEKCGFCLQILRYIDDAYGDGGRIEGCRLGKPEGVTVGDLFVLAGTIRQVPYSAKVSVTECRVYDKSGGVVSRESATVENMQFTLEQVGKEWKVRTWELQ